MSLYLASLAEACVIRFTVGDLVEGLSYLDVVWRRAALFGFEQRLALSVVVEITHSKASQLPLTTLSRAIVAESPRHIRLNYVFWQQLEGGLIAPLVDLEQQVSGAFGGMSWAALQNSYNNMALVDADIEVEDFMRVARREGLL